MISPPNPLKRGRIELNSEVLHQTGVFKYNLDLLPRAKELRENPTKAEQELWDQKDKFPLLRGLGGDMHSKELEGNSLHFISKAEG